MCLSVFKDRLLNTFMYCPKKVYDERPEDYSLSVHDISIPTRDGLTLHSWFIPNNLGEISDVPLMIYFHGVGGNMNTRLKQISELHKNLTVNILVVSYRGFGSNSGIPNETGLKIDADSVMNFVFSSKWRNSRVIVYGHSFGGAIAIYLSSRYSDYISMSIIENTFTKMADAVDDIYPFLKPLRKCFIKDDWNNLKRVGKITHPILFLSGLQDNVVHYHHTDMLFENANQSFGKEILKIPDGFHTLWEAEPEIYFKTISNFIVKYSNSNTNLKLKPKLKKKKIRSLCVVPEGEEIEFDDF